MENTYCFDDNYRESWAYQMSKFRYNQSINLNEKEKIRKID